MTEQKTITIPVPELPPHIAKEWEIDTVGSWISGQHILLQCNGVCIVHQCTDYSRGGSIGYILRRREPEREPPECLKVSGFNYLHFNDKKDAWFVMHKTWGDAVALVYLFPYVAPLAGQNKGVRMVTPQDEALKLLEEIKAEVTEMRATIAYKQKIIDTYRDALVEIRDQWCDPESMDTEWEPPQWLRESRFCKLWCDEDGWWLATDAPGSRYDLSFFFPRMVKPTDKTKVYAW